MNRVMIDLLQMDGVASRFGCGLHPKLKAAMIADLRFPVAAASPRPQPTDLQEPLPEKVVRFNPAARPENRKPA